MPTPPMAQPAAPEPTTDHEELAAMRRITAILDKLDPSARGRVVDWLVAVTDAGAAARDVLVP